MRQKVLKPELPKRKLLVQEIPRLEVLRLQIHLKIINSIKIPDAEIDFRIRDFQFTAFICKNDRFSSPRNSYHQNAHAQTRALL